MRWKMPSGRTVWKADKKYQIDPKRKAPSKGAQQVKDFILEVCPNHSWFEEYTLPYQRLRVDFLNFTKRFAIEFMGKQHDEFTPFFHGNRVGWLKSMKRDQNKERFLQLNDIVLVEIYDKDLPLTKEFFWDNYEIQL